MTNIDPRICRGVATCSRLRWNDTICLIQAENDEKDVQAQLMGDIYRQAAKVRILLGETESTILCDFAALHSLTGRGVGLSCGAVNALVTSSHSSKAMDYINSFLGRS